MPEVRQEVIVATAALVTVLLGVIGYQALTAPKRKAPFAPKKAACEPSGGKEEKSTELKSAPAKGDFGGGKILEK